MLYNVFFWGVPIVTLCTYLALLFFFAISRKDKAIKAFVPSLVSLALWSAGSLVMKLQMPPGPLFWNKIMMAGLILSPYFIYLFISVFTDTLRKFKLVVLGLITAGCVVIDLKFGLVSSAKVSTQTVNRGGRDIEQILFSYELNHWSILAYMVMLMMVVIIVCKILRCVRMQKIEFRAIRPVLIGVIIVFCGTLSNLIPVLGKYPLDILTSFIYALLTYYAIYQGRLLEMKFMITRGIVYSVFAVLITALYLTVAYHIDNALGRIELLNDYVVLGFALIVALMFQPLLGLAKRLTELLFYHSEYVQRNALRNFNISIANTLSLTEISNEFIKTVNDAMNPHRSCLLLKDSEGCYATFQSLQKLNPMELRLRSDHPAVTWLREKNTCVTRKDIENNIHFRALWDSEITELRSLDTEVLVPLRSREELVGIILLTRRGNNLAYTADDLDLLQSFGASAAMALSNAALYAKAQKEADTDETTGVYNRRFLFRYLQEQLTAHPDRRLSLVLFDLDRFKLYNELYGYTNGDNALIKVADLISRGTERRGICARYSGEQFIAVLPDMDTAAAIALAEGIRTRIQQDFQDEESTTKQFLTTSAGICTYPACAADSEQLLHRANLALLKAKENGKNTCVAYSYEQSTRPAEQKEKPEDDIDLRTTVYALTAAIDAKDHYTFTHSQNVAKYAAALARELGLDEQTQKIVFEAGMLHDVGKIGIPEDILTKSGRLTAEEYGIIQKHVDISINIVKHLSSMTHVIPAIVGHHERWDGKGYPRKIAGEKIPVEARCLAIADTFDAITSIRPYKEPLTTEFALSELKRNAGSQFDPALVRAFVDMVCSGRMEVTPAKYL